MVPGYECRFIANDIELEKGLGEELRRTSPPLAFSVPVTLEKPLSRTDACVVWSEKYVYALFRAYDRDVFAYHSERDAYTCQDDVLEFFFKTDPSREPYYNFEINALNTVYDAYSIRRETAGGDHRWRRWNCEGLRSAVTIRGTLNDPSDVDEYWELEVAVPFSSLDLGAKSRPDPGDQWLFNLGRYDYSVYLPEGVELSCTAPLTEINFHRYEDWPRMVFVR